MLGGTLSTLSHTRSHTFDHRLLFIKLSIGANTGLAFQSTAYLRPLPLLNLL
jgi:hypothetical protein